MDIINFFLLFGPAAVGGAVGSYVGNYLFCPNRGCCQMAKIKKVVEGG